MRRGITWTLTPHAIPCRPGTAGSRHQNHWVANSVPGIPLPWIRILIDTVSRFSPPDPGNLPSSICQHRAQSFFFTSSLVHLARASPSGLVSDVPGCGRRRGRAAASLRSGSVSPNFAVLLTAHAMPAPVALRSSRRPPPKLRSAPPDPAQTEGRTRPSLDLPDVLLVCAGCSASSTAFANAESHPWSTPGTWGFLSGDAVLSADFACWLIVHKIVARIRCFRYASSSTAFVARSLQTSWSRCCDPADPAPIMKSRSRVPDVRITGAETWPALAAAKGRCG